MYILFMDQHKINEMMKHHKVNAKKTEQSDAAFRYLMLNYFDKTTIVPSIHIGEASRKGRLSSLGGKS